MVEQRLQEQNELDNLEEYFEKEQVSTGFESGLELGKKHGYEEGYSKGLDIGAKRGSELGFYRGFSMTLIDLLQSESNHTAKSTRILNELNRILKSVNEFPKTNEASCDQKLFDIRLKFKQLISLLNIEIGELPFDKI